MKILKKTITFIIVLVIITSVLTCCHGKLINTISDTSARAPVRVGVLLNNFYNPYNLSIKESLEDIQKENENKIEFTFFDGKSNPAIENEIVNDMINNDYDLLLIAVIDKKESELIDDFTNKAKQKSVPLIFFNITPTKLDVIKSYPKSLIINADSVQAGILQGKTIADYWKTKKNMDKDGDNILEYIMLKGGTESFAATERTDYSISTINNAGIKTKELATAAANWDPELAENAIKSLFLKYGGNIEAIIANNDSMAIGAIKALQSYGYNLGDKAKNIPVFGINAIPEAQELIKKGFMTGSVLQNPRKFADALYDVGMNLVLGKDPLEGTNYKFDKTGVIILIPFQKYIIKE